MIKIYFFKLLSFIGVVFSVVFGGLAYLRKVENQKLKQKNQDLKNQNQNQKAEYEIKEFQAINKERKERLDEEINKNDTSDIKPDTIYQL